jgi:hypothetical protein
VAESWKGFVAELREAKPCALSGVGEQEAQQGRPAVCGGLLAEGFGSQLRAMNGGLREL